MSHFPLYIYKPISPGYRTAKSSHTGTTQGIGIARKHRFTKRLTQLFRA